MSPSPAGDDPPPDAGDEANAAERDAEPEPGERPAPPAAGQRRDDRDEAGTAPNSSAACPTLVRSTPAFCTSTIAP